MFHAVDDEDLFEARLKKGEACVPVGEMSSQRMFKPSYRYLQDGAPIQINSKRKLIRNPFDYKIILIDEIHELFHQNDNVNQTKLQMLRLMLKYATGSIILGLTATPLLEGQTGPSKVLDMIKGGK